MSVTLLFFGFFHHIMQFKILASRIKHQVILIHLELLLLFFEGKCL